MALARSASGPGGLSINTGAANLFGSGTSQAPAAGGLFGQAAATTQAPATGGLFGSTAAKPATGGLFGNSTATTQPQQASGLFGAAQTTTQAPAAGGLFGAATQTTQPAQGGGLFGNQQNQQQQQQQQQPAQAGGLFGNQQAPQQQAGGGLFGGSTQAAKPSLFGASATAAQQPQQTTSLFGGAQQQQQRPAGGLFGASTTNTAAQGGSLLGQPQQAQMGSILGGQQQQGQQAAPGVRVDLSQVKGSTKFDDLTKEGQALITAIETGIQKVSKWKDEIAGYTPVHEQEIKQLAVDVAYLQNKYELVKRAVLEGDVAAVQELRNLSNKNIDDAQTVGRAVENLKLPAHYHLPGLWTSSGANTSFSGDPNETDLIGFFNRQCAQLSERDHKLRAYLSEIQQHMPNVEGGLYQKLTALQNHMGSSNTAFEEMKATLVDMRNAIIRQAVEVGKTREALTKLQMAFLNPMI